MIKSPAPWVRVCFYLYFLYKFSWLKRRLPYLYKRVNTVAKRHLPDTIFPGPLNYDGERYRNTTMNATTAIIYLKNNLLQKIKKKRPLKKRPFSTGGSVMIQTTKRFIAHLQAINDCTSFESINCKLSQCIFATRYSRCLFFLDYWYG